MTAPKVSKPLRVTACTTPDQWPLLLTLAEVGVLLGRSTKDLQNKAAVGKLWPPPVSDIHGPIKPYRVDREALRLFMAGELPRPARRRFTPVKFRPARSVSTRQAIGGVQ